MSKFKVGDKVRVKRDLKSDTIVGDYYFNEHMADLRGEIFTIKEIIKEVGYLYYRMEGNDWSWDEEMLEEIEGEIIITKKNEINSKVFGFADGVIYTLKKKQYTFAEAFKAYEEGKEIESLLTKYKYKRQKLSDSVITVDSFKSVYMTDWAENEESFDMDEIREKWYIND